jgi:TfoX/Sxy family transcriptional regulator of competence genes
VSGQGRTNWQKAPSGLVDHFSAAMAGLAGAQVRKMFGYPAAFANGHLFTGLFAEQWMIRLPDDARAELAAIGGTPFEPMPGRPMREYLSLPDALIADPAALAPWLERALAGVLAKPPKKGR